MIMNNSKSERESLLRQMGEIDAMCRGRLTEEYRERHENGESVRLGPYYKHQVWEDGHNKSRRVKADEVEHLRKGIEGMDKFKELSKDYIDASVELTEKGKIDEADAKKNSG